MELLLLSRSSERIPILVFLWYKARNFLGITGDCRLAAAIDFIKGISAEKPNSFQLDFVSVSDERGSVISLSIDFLCCFLQVLSVTPIVNVTPMRNSAAKNKLISAASPVSVWPSQRRVQSVEMQFKACLICSGEVIKTCPISAKRGWFARLLGKNFLWRLIMCLFNLAALIFFDRDPTIRQRRRQWSRPTRKQIFQTSWPLFQITQLLESQDIGREVNTSDPYREIVKCKLLCHVPSPVDLKFGHFTSQLCSRGRQRNLQKYLMHAQSCCFAHIIYDIDVPVTFPVIVL